MVYAPGNAKSACDQVISSSAPSKLTDPHSFSKFVSIAEPDGLSARIWGSVDAGIKLCLYFATPLYKRASCTHPWKPAVPSLTTAPTRRGDVPFTTEPDIVVEFSWTPFMNKRIVFPSLTHAAWYHFLSFNTVVPAISVSVLPWYTLPSMTFADASIWIPNGVFEPTPSDWVKIHSSWLTLFLLNQISAVKSPDPKSQSELSAL